ncbi:MAG: hypothetical protein QG608_3511 [Actinomycetota bacterium]|nr:hypothetical protein [Actinomycetota bacterium]
MLTVPNLLSLLRLLLLPVFAVLLVREQDGAALAVLVLSGATDYFDGMLARRWNQVSRVGQLLDPLADRLYILCTLITLAARGILGWWLVALLVGRDLVVSTTIPLLARRGYGPLPVHLLGKAATFSLLCAFPLLLLADGDSPAALVARPFAWAFVGWGVALYWWAGWLYLRQTARLTRRTT